MLLSILSVFKHTRWVPLILINKQKIQRMSESKSLLRLLKHCKSLGWKQIYTGDESIFMIRYDVNGAWIEENDKGPIMD